MSGEPWHSCRPDDGGHSAVVGCSPGERDEGNGEGKGSGETTRTSRAEGLEAMATRACPSHPLSDTLPGED